MYMMCIHRHFGLLYLYLYLYIERIREIEIIIHITKQSIVQSKTPSYHLLKIESFEYSLIKGSNSNIEC